ncbi:MAG: hypothetical protein K6G54_06880 [Oscillospiraceae bacterium]|nr:hypothetical protein [Oscillospiraceae bacterium]
MLSNKNLWVVNRQGGLEFGLRRDLMEQEYHADSVWERPSAAIAVMLLCGTLDFVLFKQLFASFLYDHVLIQWFSITGLLVGYDLAPIYLGIYVRKRNQGFRVSTWLIGLLIFAFLLALSGNVWLRLELRDVVLPASSGSGTSLLGTVVQEEAAVNPAALPYAIFAAALPVVTSLVSFAISYITSNPLKGRLKTLNAAQVALEASAGQLEAILAEYEEDPDLTGRLTAEDDEQYETELGMTREQAVAYCDYVRQRIKERLGDPAASNELSKDSRQALQSLFERMEEVEDAVKAEAA